MFQKRTGSARYIFCISGCLFLFAAGCAPQPTPAFFIPPTQAPATAAAIIFLTPTAVEVAAPSATTAPQASATPLPPTSTPTPVCSDGLKYLEDVTLPDGSEVSAGQNIVKQWQVQNDGSCDWDARYRLKLLTDYPPLGTASELALYPARAGTLALLTITFTAPQEPGDYRTAWQAVNPDGVAFGDVVYMEILVK